MADGLMAEESGRSHMPLSDCPRHPYHVMSPSRQTVSSLSFDICLSELYFGHRVLELHGHPVANPAAFNRRLHSRPVRGKEGRIAALQPGPKWGILVRLCNHSHAGLGLISHALSHTH